MALLTEEQQGALTKALATTLGKTVAEIEQLAIDKPADLESGVSNRLRDVRKEGKDGGKGELQKELNKAIKSTFGVDAADIDTVQAAVEAVKTSYKPEVDPSQLTEEQVKGHAAFKNLEKALADKDKTHKEELEQAVGAVEQKLNAERLQTKALAARIQFGAVMAEDPKIAAVQERMYLEQLAGVTEKVIDGKSEFWKDGKRVETNGLLPMAEADYFKSLVEGVYTTKVSEQLGSPNPGGSQKPGGSGGQQNGEMKHYKGQLPKTQADADKIFMDMNLSADAIKEVNTYWKAQQQQAA